MKYIIDTDRMAQHLAAIDEAKRADFALEVLRELHNGVSLVGWITPEKKGKACPKQYSKIFDLFWELYPKKVGKGAAWKSWWVASKCGLHEVKLFSDCTFALSWQRYTEQWARDDGQFVPHATTWLNQRRWEDEQPDEILKGTDASTY